MKVDKTIAVQPVSGIVETLPQPKEGVTKLENVTVDEFTGGWDNRIGYEKFFPAEDLYGPFSNQGRVHSLYIWPTHGGARTYHLFEAEVLSSNTMSLQYTVGNTSSGASTVTIDTDRTIPTNTEAGTTYTPFGRYLVIANGHQSPIKFDGSRITDLGWYKRPSSPSPWEPIYGASSGDTQQNFAMPTAFTIGDLNSRGYGLGDDDGTTNTYKWKVSWVNENGSESPLSGPSMPASWEADITTTVYPNSRNQAVYLDGIAVGPVGTVARRIYRTKNLKDNTNVGDDEVYYFVTQIDNNEENWYVDYIGDASLASKAPNSSDSITLPAIAPRFSAFYKGCLFMDGGQTDPTKIFFSWPNHPDRFASENFFDVGHRKGGDIRGFFPYYNNLLVFRERSIDLIRGDPVSGFMVVPFVEELGTPAIDTVSIVPGVGVVFLAQDGIYRLEGGMDGGAVLNVEKISGMLLKTVGRINGQPLAKATAAYSHKWREWHCYVPVDGEAKPSLGIVYHVDKNSWSTRIGFPVGVLDTANSGTLIFGHHTGNPLATRKTATTTTSATSWESGLFVISRRRIAGYTTSMIPSTDPFSDTSVSNVTIDGPSPTSVFKSAWLDFGSSGTSRSSSIATQTKKFVKYVYLYAITEGDNTIPLTYYLDFGAAGIVAAPLKPQRPDHADQEVYDTAVWDTAVWEDGLLTEIRYPIAQKASSHFAFEVETSNDFILVGYSVEFDTTGTQTIRGKK